MKGKKALGIIETYGLTSAVEAADTAVKAANVELIGYELARGSGLTTVKVLGDVGSVKAAMSAANASVSKIGKVVAVHVIPRPHDDIDVLMLSENSMNDKCKESNTVEQKPEDKDLADELQNDEKQQSIEKEESTEQKYTCNMCKDPQCPRKKGEPRVNCIHYEEGDI
ncbi:MAG: BMC domain-containing protein [Thermoanaerobacteraceae bacterium]|nr:BMC domain-containing protein [Thermoanaerobacteraceae bacterium]